MQGNGSGFMKPITRLILGDWVPANTEFLKMSATTKECAAAAALLLGHDLGSAANLKHCHTSLTCLNMTENLLCLPTADTETSVP